MAVSLEKLTPKLRERFSYDPISGRITYSVDRGAKRAGDEAGCIDEEGYRRICLDGKLYRAHRVAWLFVHGQWPGGLIDHKNGNRSDNRIENLRVCTNGQNAANVVSTKRSITGVRGVWPFRNQWKVGITHEGRERYIGVFKCFGAAVVARRAAEQKLKPGWYPKGS